MNTDKVCLAYVAPFENITAELTKSAKGAALYVVKAQPLVSRTVKLGYLAWT